MAEKAEPAAITETKKIINPRVEIDTSPPFESVKEAVDHFGGRGPWIPHHLLRLAAGHQDTEVFDVEKMEEQAAQLERDLIIKEQETHNVLKELEAAKRFVEGFKISLTPEFSSFMASPDLKLESQMTVANVFSPGLMFMELNQAKSNLNKTSIDLAEIQASIESLNKKMRKDKDLLERRRKMQIPNSEGFLCSDETHQISRSTAEKVEVADGSDVSKTLSKEQMQLNFEAEQFKNMTEASRYEVMKAMTEIERTKNSIKMAEMRLNAAKKMEEAAKAVKAIALAERKALLNGENSSSDAYQHKPDGITLSFQEYQALTSKAKQVEELCKTKFIDTNCIQRMNQLEVPILEKFEETIKENKQSREADSFNEEGSHRTNVVLEDHFSRTHVDHHNLTKFKFRNSNSGHRNPHVLNGNETFATKEKSTPGFRSTTSIGEVLSRKLILQDEHSERQHISLSQMLRERSRLILHPTKTSEGSVEKQYIVQRKKFGFIKVPLPTKKKTQPLNQR